jgi:hypothetical protein
MKYFIQISLYFSFYIHPNITNKSPINDQMLNGAFPKKSGQAPNEVSSGILTGIKKIN